MSLMTYFKRDYIYLMWSWRMFWCVKIGVSNAPKTRRSQVEASVSKQLGREVGLTCLALPLLFSAYKFEKAIHGLAPGAMRVKHLRETNGGTEWFYNYSPFSTCLIICFLYAFFGNANAYWCGVFLLPLLPLDALLVLLLAFLLNWFLAIAGAWVVFNIFSQLIF